ncbi:hypothetical protein ABW19_dt0210520 [Dactylella cylindrospora]|nr:hypothetical protein ABW19_dt0210520 [Dactylella cylindrospora]
MASARARDEAKKEPVDVESGETPKVAPKRGSRSPVPPDACTVIILDSMNGVHYNTLKGVKEYLKLEATDKKDTTLSQEDLVSLMPRKVPGQDNFSDCGIFLLHYIEKWLENPIRIKEALYERDFGSEEAARKLWKISEVGNKRDRMWHLYVKLKEEHSKCLRKEPYNEFPEIGDIDSKGKQKSESAPKFVHDLDDEVMAIDLAGDLATGLTESMFDEVTAGVSSPTKRKSGDYESEKPPSKRPKSTASSRSPSPPSYPVALETTEASRPTDFTLKRASSPYKRSREDNEGRDPPKKNKPDPLNYEMSPATRKTNSEVRTSPEIPYGDERDDVEMTDEQTPQQDSEDETAVEANSHHSPPHSPPHRKLVAANGLVGLDSPILEFPSNDSVRLVAAPGIQQLFGEAENQITLHEDQTKLSLPETPRNRRIGKAVLELDELIAVSPRKETKLIPNGLNTPTHAATSSIHDLSIEEESSAPVASVQDDIVDQTQDEDTPMRDAPTHDGIEDSEDEDESIRIDKLPYGGQRNKATTELVNDRIDDSPSSSEEQRAKAPPSRRKGDAVHDPIILDSQSSPQKGLV